MPLESSKIPIYLPSFTLPLSLSPPSILTHTFSPYSQTLLKSGFFESSFKGVFPSMAFVGIWFINQIIWCAASPHKDLGRLLACNDAWIHSTVVQFHHSATPFCCGASWTVSFCSVSLDLRYKINSFPRYSPPQSECKILIGASNWV